jgi:hypothetical protein
MSTRTMRYENTKAGPGEQVVHNLPPEGRAFGEDGVRWWTEPVQGAEGGDRARCFCDWTEQVPEHYGTIAVVTKNGERLHPTAAGTEGLGH